MDGDLLMCVFEDIATGRNTKVVTSESILTAEFKGLNIITAVDG